MPVRDAGGERVGVDEARATKFTLMTLAPHSFAQAYRDAARAWIKQRRPVGAQARRKPGLLKKLHG